MKGFLVWVPHGVLDHIPEPLVTPVCPCRSLLTSGRHWWWIGDHSWRWACSRALDAHHKGWPGPPCVLGDTAEGNREDPGCARVHHGTGEREVVQAVCMAYQIEGKTHLMVLSCVLPVIYESADAPGIGTPLFTTFVYGKAGKYEHIC